MLDLLKSMGLMVIPQTALALVVLLLVGLNLFRVIRPTADRAPRLRRSIDAILFWGCLAAVLGLLGTANGLALVGNALFDASLANPKAIVKGFADVITTSVYGMFVLTGAIFFWFPLPVAADWRTRALRPPTGEASNDVP